MSGHQEAGGAGDREALARLNPVLSALNDENLVTDDNRALALVLRMRFAARQLLAEHDESVERPTADAGSALEQSTPPRSVRVEPIRVHSIDNVELLALAARNSTTTAPPNVLRLVEVEPATGSGGERVQVWIRLIGNVLRLRKRSHGPLVQRGTGQPLELDDEVEVPVDIEAGGFDIRRLVDLLGWQTNAES